MRVSASDRHRTGGLGDPGNRRFRKRPLFNKPSAVPREFAWPSLLARDGDRKSACWRAA
jgi:hypothetical protein